MENSLVKRLATLGLCCLDWIGFFYCYISDTTVVLLFTQARLCPQSQYS